MGEGGEHGLTVVSYFGRVWLSVLHSERWLVFVVFMGVVGVSGDRVEAYLNSVIHLKDRYAT